MHLDPWQHETLARMYQQEMPFGLQKTLFDYQRNDLASMLLSERRERPALDITYSAISDEMDRKYWINVDFDLVKEPGKYPLPPGPVAL